MADESTDESSQILPPIVESPEDLQTIEKPRKAKRTITDKQRLALNRGRQIAKEKQIERMTMIREFERLEMDEETDQPPKVEESPEEEVPSRATRRRVRKIKAKPSSEDEEPPRAPSRVRKIKAKPSPSEDEEPPRVPSRVRKIKAKPPSPVVSVYTGSDSDFSTDEEDYIQQPQPKHRSRQAKPTKPQRPRARTVNERKVEATIEFR